MAEEQRHAALRAQADDVPHLGLELARFVDIVVAVPQRLLPGHGSHPAGGVHVVLDERPAAPHRMDRVDVVEHRKPQADDPFVEGLLRQTGGHRLLLPAAHETGEQAYRRNALRLGPAVELLLQLAGRATGVSDDGLEQDALHLGPGRLLHQIHGVLLARVGVTVDVDGVLDLDVVGVDHAGFVLRARRVRGDAPFLGSGRNNVLAHRSSPSTGGRMRRAAACRAP